MFKVATITLNILLSVNGQPKEYNASYAFNIESKDVVDCDSISEKSAMNSRQTMVDALQSVGVKVVVEEFNFVGVCR